MFQDVLQSLVRWKSSTTDRQKLQHTYLVVSVLVILLAGLVSLVSAEQGHRLATVALIAIGAFLTNAVVWNLLNSAVLSKINTRSQQRNKRAV